MRTVPVSASMKAGEVAGKPPTSPGASGAVPKRWVKMDLRNNGTFGCGEVKTAAAMVVRNQESAGNVTGQLWRGHFVRVHENGID